MDIKLLLVILSIVQVSGIWWAMGRQLLLVDPTRICRKTRRLRGKQVHICQKEPDVIRAIGRGAQIGIRECQYQFRNRRWNCSTERRSLRKVLTKDTRETGFLNAISAAGVSYGITQACSLGHLEDCSCDYTAPSSYPQEDWKWGGCSDNVRYGCKKSKEFMDDRYRKRSDIKTLMLRHNYKAGRLSIKNYMRKACKCHGMSGSCTMKSCWKKLPTFRDVGNHLKKKFDGAVKVMAGNDGKSFIPEGATIKPPEREDIVYSEISPSFCEFNLKTGSLGTRSRICNSTSKGEDGCELLCCGRGYNTLRRTEKQACQCRFHWCCNVTCKTCVIKKSTSRCL